MDESEARLHKPRGPRGHILNLDQGETHCVCFCIFVWPAATPARQHNHSTRNSRWFMNILPALVFIEKVNNKAQKTTSARA